MTAFNVRFAGAPGTGEGPSEIEAFGHMIGRDWTLIDAPAAVRTKLEGNSHFEVDVDKDGEADPAIADLRAQLDELGVKYHHKAGIERLSALLAEARES